MFSFPAVRSAPLRRLAILICVVAASLVFVPAHAGASAGMPAVITIPPTVSSPPGPHFALTSMSATIVPIPGPLEVHLGIRCSIDGAAATGCVSPAAYGPLVDGPHSLAISTRSCHPADVPCMVDGTKGWGPASNHYWVIDTTPPDTTITSHGGNLGKTSDNTPTFTFTTNDADPGSSFECDSGGGWFACSSPFTPSPRSDGSHDFYVRAIDEMGFVDPSSAVDSYTVDTTPPTVLITSGPIDGSTQTVDSATFAFSSEPGVSFACSLDFVAPSPCGSPVAYAGLALGSHNFKVRATDDVGNTGSDASRTFTVAAPPPPPPPTVTTKAADACAGKKGKSLRRCKAKQKCLKKYKGKTSNKALKAKAKCLQKAKKVR